MMRRFRHVSLFISFFVSSCVAFAQNGQDSTRIQWAPALTLGTGAIVSTDSVAPFWFTANQSQRYSESPNSGWLSLNLETNYNHNRKFDVRYGFEVVGRYDGQGSTDIIQGYGAVRYGKFQVWGGRMEQHFGIMDTLLTSGSMVNNNNALPIPQIAISTVGYVPLKFTKGWLDVNAFFSHGWLEENRWIQNPYLHTKYLFFRVGGPTNWRFHAGVVHNAIWGGTRGSDGFEMPTKAIDYIRVFFGQEGGSDSFGGDQISALGNHVGFYNFAFEWLRPKVRWMIYTQIVLEDVSGTAPDHWRDGLVGLSVELNQFDYVKGVALEYINSRNMDQDYDSTGRLVGNDNYFNNYIYGSGWTYNGEVIGNPLFLINDDAPFGNLVNNRVRGLHMAIRGSLVRKLAYQLRLTGFAVDGTHFNPLEREVITAANLKMDYSFKKNFIGTMQLGYSGSSDKNTLGLFLGIRKTFP